MRRNHQQHGQSFNQENKSNNTQYNHIDNEIQHLQGLQYQQLNMTNGNNNNSNMYLNSNPSLNGYVPANGNHTMRSKLLHQPNSFVPAQFAHEINAFESHMALPYDHGGNGHNDNNTTN